MRRKTLISFIIRVSKNERLCEFLRLGIVISQKHSFILILQFSRVYQRSYPADIEYQVSCTNDSTQPTSYTRLGIQRRLRAIVGVHVIREIPVCENKLFFVNCFIVLIPCCRSDHKTSNTQSRVMKILKVQMKYFCGKDPVFIT